MMRLDDFDDCIVGVIFDEELDCNRIVYSENLISDKLLPTMESLSLDECIEFFKFNIKGSCYPMFIATKPPTESIDSFLNSFEA